MLTNEIGYIRLSQFSMQSANEFYAAAIGLQSQGMKKLVFDLRYNGGGVLGSAVSILDAILEAGTPIVSTKGKNSPERVIYSENARSEEHTSELQSRPHLVCRLLLEKKK